MAALQFIPPRVPVVDPQTGLLTREGVNFFQGLWGRTGGSDGVVTAAPGGTGAMPGQALTVNIPDDPELMFNDASAGLAELAKTIANTPAATPDDLLFDSQSAATAELSKRLADSETINAFTR